MRGEDWSDRENDLIVSDYFELLKLDLSGEDVNKSQRRRELAVHIDRSDGSIGRKQGNISAILLGLGDTYVTGIGPLPNKQKSLVDAILRWLERNPDWSAWKPKPTSSGFSETSGFRILPAPHRRNEPLSDLDINSRQIALENNIAERDECNRELGLAGELLVLKQEKSDLVLKGRNDLAMQVTHTSQTYGDGAGYDISSFDADGRQRLIEVKTTNGYARTPFHISRNECAVSEDNRESWVLLRLYNFRRRPEAFELRPPLTRHVELTPTSFLASLR